MRRFANICVLLTAVLTVSSQTVATNKSREFSGKHLEYCYSDDECYSTSYQRCVDNRCQCDVDYVYDVSAGTCTRHRCDMNSECRAYDTNRYCANGRCLCADTFSPLSSNGRKCTQTTCDYGSDCTGRHARCVRGKCGCDVDYRLSNTTGDCESFSCKTALDCHDYDNHRYCSSGMCLCDTKLFEESAQYSMGRLCVRKTCADDMGCTAFDTQSVCVDSQCRCAPNYRFDETLQKCVYYMCQNILDCLWDANEGNFSNRVCDRLNGQCVCDEGYVEEVSNGRKCVKSSSTYGMSCTSDSACMATAEVCVALASSAAQCRCAPNYKYDPSVKICQKFQCVNDLNCEAYDPYRRCRYGDCKCRDGYVANGTNGRLCIAQSSTYNKFCSTGSYCGVNERCVDNYCKCSKSYAFNENTQNCEYSDCSLNPGVCYQSYDPSRYCSFGDCVCDVTYHEDYDNGYKCVADSDDWTNTDYDYDFTWLYVVVPLCIVLSVVGVVIRYKIMRSCLLRDLRRDLNRDRSAPTVTTPVMASTSDQPPPYYGIDNPVFVNVNK